MSDLAGSTSSTDLIVSFTPAEVWVVGAGALCSAMAAFLRCPMWARWALLALGVVLIVWALR